MKSNRQKRLEIKSKRVEKAYLESCKESTTGKLIRVGTSLLGPTGTFPEFASCGIYSDYKFSCKDCGVSEIWTASQQKWWYEVANGNLYTRAARCNSCRKKHKLHAEESRQRQLVIDSASLKT